MLDVLTMKTLSELKDIKILDGQNHPLDQNVKRITLDKRSSGIL